VPVAAARGQRGTAVAGRRSGEEERMVQQVIRTTAVREHGPGAEVLVGDVDGAAGVVAVTLNRPEQGHALDPTMVRALAEAIDAVTGRAGAPTADDAVRAVLLRASGRCFCVGVDIGNLGDYFEQGFDRAADPFSALRECPVPIVGAVDGLAVTGGFELALACDVLVASRNALFMDNHPKYGLHPIGGLPWRLAQIAGFNNAKLATLASYPIDGATALRWGLVQELVDDEHALDRAALSIAGAIAYNDVAAVRTYKGMHEQLMAAGGGPDVERASDAGFYAPLGDLDARVAEGARRYRLLVDWAERRAVDGTRSEIVP
jgi:enoyl-CoA hydratase